MRKLYFSLLLALVCFSTSFGQTVVNQGFESGGSMPTGWTSTIISGSYTWAVCTNMPYNGNRAPHSGSYQVFFDCWNGTSGTTGILVSPVVDYTSRAGAATNVTMWFYRENGSCAGVNDYTQVYVNTSPNLSGTPTSLGIVPRWYTNAPSGGASGSNGVAGWQQYSFSVPTTYNGATNYIIFKGVSAYGTCMGMDDIQYTTYPCTAPTAGTISGNSAMCGAGDTRSLTTSGTAGGTWSSSNTGVATVGSSSGVVTAVSPGTATITYSVSACSITATATAVVTVNAVPTALTGTSSACVGFTSALSSSPSGGTWSSSATGVATVNTSGVVTAASPGTSTISYNLGNGCAAATTTFTVNSNPASITGTATACGGSAPSTVSLSDATSGGTWSSSNTAVATVGSSTGVVTGVSSGTATISYTLPTGCFATASQNVNSVANISGSPSVCIGFSTTLTDATSGGVWSSSNPSVATVGSSSGVVTSVSVGCTNISYSVSSLGCAAVMTVCVTNAPTTYAVTGGGAYCAGGSGVHIGVNSSNSGVSYTLFNGATLVSTIFGTGGAIDFGLFTASGTYTVVANYGTPCSATMAGSATVSVNPLPTAFTVAGGGAYCSGGTGVSPTLSSSTIGVNYQLMLGSTPIGSPIVGTSSALSFPAVTTAGAYSVVATNTTTGCVNTMSGFSNVTINPLPNAFSVTGGGGYCLGGSGVHIGVAGSQTGVTYQLLLSGSPVGSPLSGTTSALDFGFITTGGNYTVTATITSTGCTNSMSGVATVTVNPLPTVYTVTGGGNYCIGGTGVPVGINGSTTGVNYQLMLGSTPIGSPVAGTGVALSFGNQTATGSYTVVATNVATGCINNMFGSVSVGLNPLPTVFTVTGGGGYCAGGAGVNIGISGSTAGTTYQLYNGTTLVSAASGTGSPINFTGTFPVAGTYTVNATNGSTGCTGGMSGSATVVINPLPTVFTVTGGGSYCAGGAGIAVGLNGSTTGVNYQLYNGATAVGSPVAGTGSAIAFGNQTAAGSYTVVAVNATTTCNSNMSGSAVVTINPAPTVYAVTGGGGYCTGGPGVHIGLAASNTGISYQLVNSGGAVGGPVTGTGAAIDFGFISPAGTYSVTATNTTTSCASAMSGTATVVINPLPGVFSVTGGGNYCAGGTGMTVGLSGSVTGINYQLYNGTTTMGSPVAGTGSAISFGSQTAAGTYTVVATNAATGCTSNMTGSVAIGINPLPAVFTVTGGGAYCSGMAGVHVGLSGSASGINYQLYNGAALVGTQPGTGSAIDFGLMTGAGTYTVIAANGTTSCTNNMTGSAVVTINPLPGLFTITGGGNYCAGGTGVTIGLSGSAIGISYQLYNGGTPVGSPMIGTNLALNFGLQTGAGTYYIIGTNMATGCQSSMTGTTTINVNALPALHTVTGGGSYCVGGTGVSVDLDGSNTGTNYQLYNGTMAVGSPVAGTGSAISFGLQTSSGIYTVKATNTTTTCVNNMSGSATVGTYPLPVVYNVTGGGNYCSGGTGVHIGLSGSNTGVSYQLWNGSAPVGSAIPGGGVALDFGLQSAAGTYTITATNNVTGCTNNMNGSAVVGINALPAAHNVMGGGNYCAGGTGVHVSLDGSNVGTLYQLYNGVTPVGAPMAGTGSAIDFGSQTAAGTYTIGATVIATTCTNMMTGSVNVVIDPLPNVYTVTGGGNYCSGGTGVSIGLSNSDAGISYSLMTGSTTVGSPILGSGSAIDFGPQTTAGSYSILATDLSTSCMVNMLGAIVAVDPLPTAYVLGGGGSYCAGGTGVHITLSGSNAGITYQLYNGSSPVGSAVTGTGMGLDFGLVTGAGTYTVKGTNGTTGCIGNMSGSVTVAINPLPTVYSVSSTSSTYCAGGGGVNIFLNNSDAGINYQLYHGTTTVGSPMPGTGGTLNFGFHFAAGSYTIGAVNTTTGCANTMASGVSIVVNPLPTVYTVTGGGSYCSGSAGVHVGLGGSTSGISYQLYNGSTAVGSPVIGTGGAIDFGFQTGIGNYTVVATNNATTCTNNMSGSVAVAANPLPSTYTVTGGGNFCAGGTGVNVGLSNSTLAVTYQLYRSGTIPVGSPVAGTGSAISFGPQNAAGTYTVVATSTITGCTNSMAGSAIVGLNAAPTAYSVVGGGNFCPGGAGVHVGVSASNTGISYQLYNGSTMTGTALTGTGFAIDFGLQTAAGTYTVVATDMTTGCTNTMSGSATVVINALPAVYSVIGGGNYCAGGAGVHVGLSNSNTGINYILYNGFTAVSTLAGSGGPLDFGLLTAAGNYTVQATNTTTGCTTWMTGTSTIVVNPLVTPTISIATADDTICEGTFTAFNAVSTNGGTSPLYQWSVNGTPSAVGAMYSYVPTNHDVVSVTMTSSAACATPTTVSSTITMTVDPKQSPSVSVTTTPGNVVCQGTSVTFTASPSYGGTAPSYTWVKNNVNVGASASYTYIPANGDVVYCVLTSNYHCRLADNANSSHINMTVDVPVLPVVTITTNTGLTVAPGQQVIFTASVVNGGPAPAYQWLLNGIPVPGAVSPTFVNSNFSDGDSVTCQVLSSGGCLGLLGFNAVRVHVRGVGVAQVTANDANLKLIPNPTNGAFTVKGSLGTSSDQDVTIEVTDMIGQVIYTGNVTARKGDLNEKVTLDKSIANGMYILNVRTATGNKVFHLVVEQ